MDGVFPGTAYGGNPSLFEIAGLEDVMDSVIGDIRNLQGLRDVFERVRPEVERHGGQPIVRDSYKDPLIPMRQMSWGP